MAPKSFNLHFSCIFLLILLNPFLLSHANSPQSNIGNPSPLFYLNNLIGVRKGHTTKGLSNLKKYFSDLGYMNNNNIINSRAHSDDDLFDDDLELAVKKYQLSFHLEVNGVLDAETVEKLLKPRCGVGDFVNLNASQFQNRIPTLVSRYTFFPAMPKWPSTKRTLTYSFPPDTRKDVVNPIKDATKQWSKVTYFKFRYITNYDEADIKISFQFRDHGDGEPFDGPLGILAHAFAPTDGRLHFDGDERWIDGVAPDEFDLETVGMHELGHILGLGHSSDSDALMYPIIPPGIRKGLGQDDIKGITALYQT